ncbi:hypothetical protein HOY82DRAFT_642242 [Tuber indicum]|nr:hypothetical protein HOY82DRAFT_642242 [Tuber indicum]
MSIDAYPNPSAVIPSGQSGPWSGPQVGSPQPPKPEPPDAQAKLPDAQAKPIDAQAKPTDAQVKPPDAQAMPTDAQAKLSDAQAKSTDALAKPSDAQAKPPDVQVKPTDAQAKPTYVQDSALTSSCSFTSCAHTVVPQYTCVNYPHNSPPITEKDLRTDLFCSLPPYLHIDKLSDRNSINMEDLNSDLVLGSDFLEEVHPDDSVSQTYYRLNAQLPSSTTGDMEVDAPIPDPGSSIVR